MLGTNPVLTAVLHQARTLDLPGWWVAAGAIVQTVWNHVTRRDPGYGIKDYDLIYYDSSDLSREAENVVIRAGRRDPPTRTCPAPATTRSGPAPTTRRIQRRPARSAPCVRTRDRFPLSGRAIGHGSTTVRVKSTPRNDGRPVKGQRAFPGGPSATYGGWLNQAKP
ncbi:nucleotidyltransferase family protein [Nonomuraea diastatica]|uniref:nucleotidyltransferase family protein n=1 Tax=Nonomuraea diastatica TaxID=1848329 RepID=UPI001C7009C3